MGISITGNFMETKFREHIHLMANYLAGNAEAAILVKDKFWLKKLTSNLLQGENDIKKIIITNKQGNKLIEMAKNINGPYAVISAPVLPQKMLDTDKLFSPASIVELQDVFSPKPIGMVEITYSTHQLRQLQVTMTRRYLLLMAVLSVMAGIIYYFISRFIVKEIRGLVKVSQKIAAGDFNLRAKPGRLPEVRKLVKALNVMLDSIRVSNKALEEANNQISRQKYLAEMGQFSLVIAHEFKNPLGIIKSSIDVLKNNYQEDQTRETALKYINEEVYELNKLIENFLLFAKPATPAWRILNADNMLTNLINRLRLVPENSCGINDQISLTPSIVKADPDLLGRALANIIRNACEAEQAQEHNNPAAISVISKKEDNNWLVTIADTGPGIESANITKIFEPFFSTKAKGCGLGLAFAHQVIQAHNGNITAENQMEGGALFTIKLPLHKEDNS